jgi:hypothetical protein
MIFTYSSKCKIQNAVLYQLYKINEKITTITINNFSMEFS